MYVLHPQPAIRLNISYSGRTEEMLIDARQLLMMMTAMISDEDRGFINSYKT